MEISLSLASARKYSKYCYLDQVNQEFYQSRLNSVLDNLEEHITCFQFNVNGLLREKNLENLVYVPKTGLDLVERLVSEYSNYIGQSKNEPEFEIRTLGTVSESKIEEKISPIYQEAILQFLEKLPLQLLSNSFNNLESVKKMHYDLVISRLKQIKNSLKSDLIVAEKLDPNNPDGYGNEEIEKLISYSLNGKTIDLNFQSRYEKLTGNPLIEMEDDSYRVSKLYKKDQIKNK